MVTVKFIVLVFLIVSCPCYSKYCKICANHTLCQYSTPGPGVSCKEYDRNKFLTDDDIYDLVNQMNERRNFIALGHSRHLPSAANMNKLVWSVELATFAQRWVDQCDPSLRPDEEDQCRDLEHTNVGQSIASIISPSARFSVKSFVEMWFMHLLEYKGSVSYYDKFQDHKSKYFTQLIWAKTKNVGCGRAKFNVNNVTVDRIVCNFSPKGNIHGKPIYNIGFPRTQCQNQHVAHEKFQGLCTLRFARKAKLPASNLQVSSVLKILNLSNDSVKQEIDPIYNNIKHITQHRNETEKPKQQKMRHVFGNKLQSKRTDLSLPRNFWESPVDVSRNYKTHFHNNEKVHAKLTNIDKSDHSHDYKYNDQATKRNQMADFRKYVGPKYSDDNNENVNNFKYKCTRSTETHLTDCNHSSNTYKKMYKCTRRLINNRPTQSSTDVPQTFPIPYQSCSCSTAPNTAIPSTYTQHKYSLDCECENDNGLTVRCPNLPRTNEGNAHKRKLAVESETSLKDAYHINPEEEYEWLFNKRRKNIPQSKRSHHIQSNRNRYKRGFIDASTFKPFWQIDGFSNSNPQLKALRYTTLPNKRHQKSKKYTYRSFTTESITIQLKNTKVQHVTEKYLSFDELLHLRKFNFSGNNARRQMESQILRNPAENKNTTVATESLPLSPDVNSTEYTANTPFKRMKHCTRKLTCTWTAASLTDSNGSVVGGQDRGSRTPPGYVEGCTRTSTCTRDYMNRNKFPTTITSSTNDDDDNENNDSDYCERRSLHFRKRHSHKKRSFSKNCQKRVPTTDLILSYSTDLSDHIILNNKYLRNKRSLKKYKYTSNSLSYGDLYYLVLRKIVGKWENNKIHNSRCPCNAVNDARSYLHMFLLLSLFTFIFL